MPFIERFGKPQNELKLPGSGLVNGVWIVGCARESLCHGGELVLTLLIRGNLANTMH